MAAEIFCTRWTALLLRELFAGRTRFNDLRRGMPRMSPALLSKRLKELEGGRHRRVGSSARRAGSCEYRLTRAGRRPEAVVIGPRHLGPALGRGRRARCSNLDPSLLMWDMRRNLDPDAAAAARCGDTVRVSRNRRPGKRNWWLMVEPVGETDLCRVDPGFDVDLYVVDGPAHHDGHLDGPEEGRTPRPAAACT